MNEKIAKLLNELGQFGAAHSCYNIPPETGKFFSILIKTAKSKNILEIGACNGYSAIWLAEAAKENKGKVTTIEISDSKVKMAMEHFKKAKLNKMIKIIHGDALKEIPKLKGKFDFVFIDAIKKDYLKYLKLAEKKIKKGCIIVADNAVMFKDYMKDYLNYVGTNKNYSSVLVPIGSGVEFSIKIK